MNGQEDVVARVEGGSGLRGPEGPPAEAPPAAPSAGAPAGVTMAEPADVAEEPSLRETLDEALTPGPELDDETRELREAGLCRTGRRRVALPRVAQRVSGPGRRGP